MQKAGLPVSVAEHNLVVRACVTAGRVSQALAWVRYMRLQNVSPDVHTFARILPAATTRLQIRRTVDVLRELYDANYLPTTKVPAVDLCCLCVAGLRVFTLFAGGLTCTYTLTNLSGFRRTLRC